MKKNVSDVTLGMISKSKKECEKSIIDEIAKAVDIFEIKTGLTIKGIGVHVTEGTGQSLPIIYVEVKTDIESLIK